MPNRSNQPRTVALALELGHPWEWHQAVYAGTQRYAERVGRWRCVIDEFPEREFRSRVDGGRRYDGVIARATTRLVRAARRHGVPVVNVWTNSPVRGAPSVLADLATSGRLAARHLVDRGFRRFGFVGRDDIRGHHAILGGFTEELALADLAPEFVTALPIVNEFTPRTWTSLLKSIDACLEHVTPPMGLYVDRGYHARQVVHACQDRGWSIARDVAIVCSENEPVLSEGPSPSLTAVDLNWREVGYQAARLLDELVNGQPEPSAPILVPPKGVVARASTDFFAVEDELVAAALQYISAHLGRTLSVDSIARAVATSPRTLQRRFREHLGRSVASEIRRLRVELAQRLLGTPEHSISEVARTCGFGTTRRLHEVLQREIGLGTRALRAKLLMESERSRSGSATKR